GAKSAQTMSPGQSSGRGIARPVAEILCREAVAGCRIPRRGLIEVRGPRVRGRGRDLPAEAREPFVAVRAVGEGRQVLTERQVLERRLRLEPITQLVRHLDRRGHTGSIRKVCLFEADGCRLTDRRIRIYRV